MSHDRRHLVPLVALSLIAALLLSASPISTGTPNVAAAKPPPTPTPADSSAKLRGDLAALVAGSAVLDPRIPELVPGYVPGELPYFALLSEPFDAAHAEAFATLGVRVLR